jgi:hypothetical protein
MKYRAVVLASAAAVHLSGCGMNSDEVRQHFNRWVGQTDTALTAAFGVPQKTLDMAGGNKVYHYEFDKGHCLLDFQVSSKQVVTNVQTGGSDVGSCPRKLPGGGTF